MNDVFGQVRDQDGQEELHQPGEATHRIDDAWNAQHGRELRGGRIDELDANGGAEVYHQFQTQGLGGFTTVNVVDRAGELVLTGTIDQSS